MYIEDAFVGQRVVPHSRTVLIQEVPTPRRLIASVAWRRARAKAQLTAKPAFLVVVNIDEKQGRLLCGIEGEKDADWFMEYDVEPLTDK